MATDIASTGSARPTVHIDGRKRAVIDNGVIAMRMREAVGGLSSLELRISDWASHADNGAGFTFANEAIVKLGSAIKVYAGVTGEPQAIFDGVVTALEIEAGPEAAPTFAVLAEDKLQRARKTRRSRIFENMNPAALVKRIATDHGLEAQGNRRGPEPQAWSTRSSPPGAAARQRWPKRCIRCSSLRRRCAPSLAARFSAA
jgi:hypothetical protein